MRKAFHDREDSPLGRSTPTAIVGMGPRGSGQQSLGVRNGSDSQHLHEGSVVEYAMLTVPPCLGVDEPDKSRAAKSPDSSLRASSASFTQVYCSKQNSSQHEGLREILEEEAEAASQDEFGRDADAAAFGRTTKHAQVAPIATPSANAGKPALTTSPVISLDKEHVISILRELYGGATEIAAPK